MARRRRPTVSLLGAGTVGSVIARALHDQGYPIVSIINRSARPARALARAVSCSRVSTDPGDLHPDTGLLLIAVSDDEIAHTAARLARLKLGKHKGRFVVHCSGAQTSELLDPLRRQGALVASLHPIQTFPKGERPAQARERLKGIFYGIEGRAEALSRARALVADLGGTPVVIPRELKVLYHIMCVFASNYYMVFLHTISDLAGRLGFGSEWTTILGPLMTASMKDAVRHPRGQALTGPIVRKDLRTIGRHLETLGRSAPHFLPLYASCGIELARLAKARGRLGEQDFRDVCSLFTRSMNTISITTR